MELPQDLRIAIDQERSDFSRRELAPSTQALSDRYRKRNFPGGDSFLQGKGDSAAYGAFRMPATFAAVYGALKQTLLERDQGMISLGQRLAAHSHSSALQGAQWRSLDLTGPWESPLCDLVIASYFLGELAERELQALLQHR